MCSVKAKGLVCITMLSVLFFLPSPLLAGEANNAPASNKIKAKKPLTKTASYVPSPGKKSKPLKRITVGAPRGSDTNLELSLFVSEDHIVTEAQPSLQWQISQPTKAHVIFMLVTEELTDPVTKNIFTVPESTNMQTVNLKDYDVSLVAGTEYEWSIQLCSTSECNTPASDTINRTIIRYQPD